MMGSSAARSKIRKIILLAALLCCNVTMGTALANDGGDAASAGDVVQKEEKKMLKFDEQIVRRVLKEDGYSEQGILIELNLLEETDARMQLLLDAYLEDRSILNTVNVEGITLNMLMDIDTCNFWNAFNLLDLIMKNPKLVEGTKLRAESIYELRRH